MKYLMPLDFWRFLCHDVYPSLLDVPGNPSKVTWRNWYVPQMVVTDIQIFSLRNTFLRGRHGLARVRTKELLRINMEILALQQRGTLIRLCNKMRMLRMLRRRLRWTVITPRIQFKVLHRGDVPLEVGKWYYC